MISSAPDHTAASKTVGLAMLVRDEQDTLPDTLPAMLDLVDTWTIIDTGSTDHTRVVAAEICEGMHGKIIDRPWVNFAHNRTELLREAAGQADYTLMLDADHRPHVTGARPPLDADSYLVPIRGTGQLSWRLPLLTRSAHPFEYRGAAHSYLATNEPADSRKTDWITVDGGPAPGRDKLERDRAALEQAFLDNPADARTVFYLAQTYKDLGMIDRAIQFYRLRTLMGGWDEEVYYARLQAGTLLSQHVSIYQGAPELLRAYLDRPTRAEALRALANVANAVADKTPLPDDRLFVRPNDYRQEAAA